MPISRDDVMIGARAFAIASGRSDALAEINDRIARGTCIDCDDTLTNAASGDLCSLCAPSL